MVEVLIAGAISIVISIFVLSLLFFFGRTLNDTVSSSARRNKIDMVIDRFHHDLLLTFKKDPFEGTVHPIDISDNEDEIVYRIITPCPGEGGAVVKNGSSEFCWGDGVEPGRYIRIYLDADHHLWREIWDGKPSAGGTLLRRDLLAEDVDFRIVGFDSSGTTVNNKLPVEVKVNLKDRVLGYERVIQVKLRGM